MILLDTNIVSELMKSIPSPKVVDWINQQDSGQLYVTVITIAEISYGLQMLPNGKRRHLLEIAFENTITEAFQQRILVFDDKAAYFYGKIMGKCKVSGHPMSVLDGQIAAMAQTHDLSLATRNVKDFQNCDLMLINPFVST